MIDGVLEDAVNYMKQRHAFGKPIGQFQALQHYVADIATMQTSTALLLHYCARKQSRGENVGNEANMLKLMASENANKAADLGIQILGGMGYSAETDMQRYWRIRGSGGSGRSPMKWSAIRLTKVSACRLRFRRLRNLRSGSGTEFNGRGT